MLGTVHDVDIKLLRIFFAIYECGGFTQAQSILGMSQANISSKMAKLEARLGARLCDRGTSGFKLTPEGDTIIQASKQLFNALDTFQLIASDVGKELTGTLNIGLVDNAIKNPRSHIDDAIARFMTLAPAVDLNIFIGDPAELEVQVLDGHLQIAIGLFNKTNESLGYTPLYTTEHALFCGQQHPLFIVPDEEISEADLISTRYLDRGYIESIQEFKLNIDLPITQAHSHNNIDGIALLVLSGRHTACLPLYYAKQWVDTGKMRILKRDKTTIKTHVLAIYKNKKALPKITATFLTELERCHSLA